MKNNPFITVFSVFAALFLWRNTASAQVTPTIDHITVYVVDLQKSADFYKNVMLLKEIFCQ